MTRAPRHGIARGIALLLAMATAAIGGCRWRPDREEFMRLTTPTPDELAKDELALWRDADDTEAKLLAKGGVLEDEALSAYLMSVVRRLLPEAQRAAGSVIRVHVLEDNELMASVAPNGAIYVSVGLLAALANEAQLASVLAHELAHFLARHSLANARTEEATGSTLQRMRLSRLQEREADEVGSWMMQDAGYDVAELERAMAIIQAQDTVDERGIEVAWRTHPVPRQRMQIAARIVEGRTGGEVPVEPYESAISEALLCSARIALDAGTIDEARRALDRHGARGSDVPRSHFLRGRLRQLTDPAGEASRAAIVDFERAREGMEDDPSLLRTLALAYRQAGRRTEAAETLDRYLALVPKALDEPILRAYLAELTTANPTRERSN